MMNWKSAIEDELAFNNESWADVIDHTFRSKEMETEFDGTYGTINGSPFTLWTSKRVYFPVTHEGMEWVDSAPRFPCIEKMKHVGG